MSDDDIPVSPEDRPSAESEGEGREEDDSDNANANANANTNAKNVGFPIGASVIIHGLTNSPQYNGSFGEVRSELNASTGRQQVWLPSLNRAMALRRQNLQYEPRDVESLSVKEMKRVLGYAISSKGGQLHGEADFTGLDKSDLRKRVKMEIGGSPDAVSKALALSRSYDPSTSARSKSVPNSNSNSKSQTAASPSSNSPTAAGAGAAADPATAIGNLNPEQLKRQAAQLRSMDPDVIRRMNPQMANYSNEQIAAAAQQMEQMAENPAMLEFAKRQMQAMSPEDVERLKQQPGAGIPPSRSSTQGSGSGSGSGSNPRVGNLGEDPVKLLQSMTPEQVRAMMAQLKSDPAARQQVTAASGVSDDQLLKGIEWFGSLDDDRLRSTLSWMASLQKWKQQWDDANSRVGGSLKWIVLVGAVMMCAVFAFVIVPGLRSLMQSSAGGTPLTGSDTAPKPVVTTLSGGVDATGEEDEFAGEF